MGRGLVNGGRSQRGIGFQGSLWRRAFWRRHADLVAIGLLVTLMSAVIVYFIRH